MSYLQDKNETQNACSIEELVSQNASLALRIGKMQRELQSEDINWDDQNPTHQLLEKRIQYLSNTVLEQASEIEALTQMLEQHPAAQYVTNLERYAEQLEFNYILVTSSKSWKITSSLRAVTRFLLRKEAPPQLKPKFFGGHKGK